MTAKRTLGIFALVSVLPMLFSCSSAPSGPKMGTPAFYWQAAKEVYAAGDYNKTLQHLDNLLATDNEYNDRALPWALVLKSGLAAGYIEGADNYAVGARLNRSDPSLFRRQVSEYRDSASRMALTFAEDYGRLSRVKGDTIALVFAYPKGTASPVPQFTKITSGIPLPAAETDAAQARVLERGVLLAACRAAGAPDDTAKTEGLLRTGTASVPRATFLMAMAEALYNDSQIYVADKLDQPQKLVIFCERAADALKGVPESKATKALDAKIQAALKKANK